MTTPPRFQVGIIGFGKMGKLHAKGYTAVGAHVRWVLDPHVDAAVCPYAMADDIGQLLQQCNVISICSPSSTHVDWAEQSFKAGIHTFIEKPLALTAADCLNLVRMHKQSGLSFRAGVGHIERFNPAFQVLLENIYRVGTIEAVHAVRTNPSSGRIFDADVVSDLTVHDLDLMRAVCGGDRLDNVDILAVDYQRENGVLDAITLEAILNRIRITAHTSRVDSESQRLFTVQGNKGKLSADLRQTQVVWTGKDKQDGAIPVQPCDQIISQMGAWLTAVTRATKPVVGLTDGLFAVRACDSIRQAVVVHDSKLY